jgi:hypothetical protein
MQIDVIIDTSRSCKPASVANHISYSFIQAQDKVTSAQKKLDDKARNLCGKDGSSSKCDYKCNVQIRLEMASELEHRKDSRLVTVHEDVPAKPVFLEVCKMKLPIHVFT